MACVRIVFTVDKDPGLIREEDLLVAVGQGDEVALRDLYGRFERPLYALAYRWYQDKDLAEDLVQEVTVRIWKKAHTYDLERGTASAWIFGVARHLATDLVRAKGRRPTPVEEPIASDTRPWDEDDAWRQWEVAKAVAELPPDQQDVVRLAFNHHHTQSEIATRLDLPLGTVKTRMRLALQKLEPKLVERGLLEGSG